MQPLSRRGVALLATAATLGAGSLTTATQAFAAPPSPNIVRVAQGGILDILLQGLLNSIVVSSTPAQIQTTVNGLTSGQIGSLLGAANTGQLTALLGGLNTGQLTGAVDSLASVGQLSALLTASSPTQVGDLLTPLTGGTLSSALALLSTAQITSAFATLNAAELSSVIDGLTAGQTGSLLGGLSAGNLTQLTSVLGALNPAELSSGLGLLNAAQLTSVVGALNPAQITSVLGSPGASASLVTGLSGKASSLGATPSLDSVSALTGQLQALLGGGLPAVPGIDGLLTTVQSLVAIPGLDTSMLTGLLSTALNAARTAAPGVDTSSLLGLIGTLYGVLGGPAAGHAGAGAGTQPAQGAKPLAGQAGYSAYRATIAAIKVAANRRSAKVTVSCPTSAPKGCLVTLNGLIAGKKAFASKTFVVMRNVTRTYTMKLSKATAVSLNKRGGALSVSALTGLSTLSAVTKTVKLARKH
jgi:hypothetical protein